MIKNVFVLTPKYKGIVKGRTQYTNNDGETFILIRFYNSIRVAMIAIDELPIIQLDELIMGDNIIQFLANRYPGCLCQTRITDFCGIDFSRKMPDDVREKLTRNPDYCLYDDGWSDNSEHWFYDFDSQSHYADEVLVYSPFVATHTKSIKIDTVPKETISDIEDDDDTVIFTETIVGEPPLPVEKPIRGFASVDEELLPELSWEGIEFD